MSQDELIKQFIEPSITFYCKEINYIVLINRENIFKSKESLDSFIKDAADLINCYSDLKSCISGYDLPQELLEKTTLAFEGTITLLNYYLNLQFDKDSKKAFEKLIKDSNQPDLLKATSHYFEEKILQNLKIFELISKKYAHVYFEIIKDKI